MKFSHALVPIVSGLMLLALLAGPMSVTGRRGTGREDQNRSRGKTRRRDLAHGCETGTAFPDRCFLCDQQSVLADCRRVGVVHAGRVRDGRSRLQRGEKRGQHPLQKPDRCLFGRRPVLARGIWVDVSRQAIMRENGSAGRDRSAWAKPSRRKKWPTGLSLENSRNSILKWIFCSKWLSRPRRPRLSPEPSRAGCTSSVT